VGEEDGEGKTDRAMSVGLHTYAAGKQTSEFCLEVLDVGAMSRPSVVAPS
jgi:hypothetical protein